MHTRAPVLLLGDADTLGDVRWERFLVFYHDVASQEVRMVDVPLVPASFERGTPQPIDRFNSLLGVRPLSAYLVGGRVLGNHITVFEPEQPPGKRLTVHLHTVQPSSIRGNPDLTLDITASALNLPALTLGTSAAMPSMVTTASLDSSAVMACGEPV